MLEISLQHVYPDRIGMVSRFFVFACEPLEATARGVISKLSYQPGLSDTCWTGGKHNAPRPVQRRGQLLQQKGQLFLTPYDRLSADGRSRFTHDRP